MYGQDPVLDRSAGSLPGTRKKGREEFPAGNMSFVSISDMNDAHFELRKDGSFEYYRLLF